MRRIFGWVAVGLGTFLLVAGGMSAWWADDQVMRTPLDVDSVTRLDGNASVLNTETGELDDFDVRATSFNKVDSDASDDDVAVFVANTCLVKDVPDTPDCGVEGTDENADPNIINVSELHVFASDRRTAEAVNDPGYLPQGTPETKGLVNKWPFDTQQQDYEVWDGLLDRAITATFAGEEDLDGLTTYVFEAQVTDEPAEVIDGTNGLYTQSKRYWVEPETGSIINQTQQEQRSLEDGPVLLDLDIAFTNDQVTANIDDAKSSVSSLRLLTETVPRLGVWVGVPLVVIGLLALLLGWRSGRDADSADGEEGTSPLRPQPPVARSTELGHEDRGARREQSPGP